MNINKKITFRSSKPSKGFVALKISAIIFTAINESKTIQIHKSMGSKKLTIVNNLEMRLFFGFIIIAVVLNTAGSCRIAKQFVWTQEMPLYFDLRGYPLVTQEPSDTGR